PPSKEAVPSSRGLVGPDHLRCSANGIRQPARLPLAGGASTRRFPRFESCVRLLFEKPALPFYTPAVARQCAVVADHAMTGDDHGQLVGATGLRDRTYRTGTAD